MKSTGIVRNVDNLDRIVIPKELCKTLHIAPKDSLEIFVDGNNIVLRKYEPSCIFCGEATETIRFEDKIMCRSCLKKIGDMLGKVELD